MTSYRQIEANRRNALKEHWAANRSWEAVIAP